MPQFGAPLSVQQMYNGKPYPSFYNPVADLKEYEQGILRVKPGWTPYGDKSGRMMNWQDSLITEAVKWRQANNIPSAFATPQGRGNALIIVDGNNDFVLPTGNLSVPGALQDMERITSWIYRNVHNLDHIVASIDAHLPIQIFHRLFWLMRSNAFLPDPMQMVNLADLNSSFVPMYRPDWDQDWVQHYIEKLGEKDAVVYLPDGTPVTIEKSLKALMIWTTHCLIGSINQALNPMLHDVLTFLSAARAKNWVPLEKGTNEWTEWYSILQADVAIASDTFTQINAKILDALMNYKHIYVCGWAKSHCVFETIKSLVWFFKHTNPAMLKRLHLVMDGMSSVGPIYDANGNLIVDFEAACQPQYEQWAKDEGINLVYTTDNGGMMLAA